MINAAILGLGWWGQNIVRLLKGSTVLKIAVAIDPAEAAADTARSLGVPLARDFDSVLADRAIDAVILCTPHTLHHRQILQSAAAGKHVFCEKPLCLELAHAVEAVEACRRAGLVLGIGHERRFEPPVRELRHMVERGDLGRILQIEANFSQDKFLSLAPTNWRLSSKEAPAGPMTATGIHLLDLAGSFLGPADTVLCRVAELGSDLANGDTLAALVTYSNGGYALISAILATPFEGRFALYGSKGWAEVRDKAHPESPEGWLLATSLRGAPRSVRDFPPSPSVLANLEAFARAVAGNEPYPVPAAELTGTVAVLEAAFRSAGSGRIEAVARPR
jgi:predicted dehydrogenase